MEQFEYTTATIAEKLFFGLEVTALGLGTVFAVLFLLWLLLVIFQYVFGGYGKKENNSVKPEKTIAPAVAPVPAADDITEDDDTELIAVLMAAICAATGTSNPANLRIVSYKRQKTPWNRK